MAKREKFQSLAIGGSPPDNWPRYWSGTGFIDVAIGGDTLKIKKPMNEIAARQPFLMSYSVPWEPKLYLYYDESADFFILREEYRFCLLIRRRPAAVGTPTAE